jgi:DNA-binding NarL/FixJ family response regulator
MGIVLRATDRITGEDVTLKRLTVSTEELEAQLPDNLMLPPIVPLHARRAFAAQATTPPPRSRMSQDNPLELALCVLEVLQGAAAGERNKEIAYRLGILSRTVKAHLTSVYNKLGVDSRAAAFFGFCFG